MSDERLEELKASFYSECRELLEQMEDALLILEENQQDESQIDQLFRAVHTIKGSAGLFGLDDIVDFTHIAENLMDNIRGGLVGFSTEIGDLLFKCKDHISNLVENAMQPDGEISNEALFTIQNVLLAALQEYVTEKVDLTGADNLQPASGSESEKSTWVLQFKAKEGLYKFGTDPYLFLKYLEEICEVVSVNLNTDIIPPLEDMDPMSCCFEATLVLRGNIGQSDILEAFEFIEDDIELQILPPGSDVTEYIEAICSPSDTAWENLRPSRLGEILVDSGIIDDAQLESALQEQANSEAHIPLGEAIVESGAAEKSVVEAALSKQRDTQKAINTSIRVDADKLNALIDLVGELVISNSNMQLLAKTSNRTQLQETVESQATLVEDIRHASMNLRMVQIGDSLSRFKRIVRDTSKKLEKDIKLHIKGGETELDKTLIEKINDPLTHLLRNCMDHGIESPEKRVESGKARHGTIEINAFHESGCVVIEVSDDGAGLDREKILAKAKESNLPNVYNDMSDNDVLQLIFSPGLSTKSEATELSGRGVGMDVVKSNIESLRGTVSVQSTPMKGTKFTISIPLTMAIIDGFLFKACGEHFVIPLNMIHQCIEMPYDEWKSVEHNDFIDVRGELVHMIHLSEELGISGDANDWKKIVVVKTQGIAVGIVVDELLGDFQTVIKPMGKIFQRHSMISGATILGSGDIAMILDASELIKIAIQAQRDRNFKSKCA